MCLYPRLIKNRKFEPNKKNGGVPPPVNDKRTLLVPVGCGKCMECMRKKANDWRTRLLEEIKESKKCQFVTLTLSNDSYKKLDIEINDDVRGYEREKNNILETLQLIKENTKGKSLENILTEIETTWAKTLGLRSGDATQTATKIIDIIIKLAKKPK